jgi:cell division control protein 45
MGTSVSPWEEDGEKENSGGDGGGGGSSPRNKEKSAKRKRREERLAKNLPSPRTRRIRRQQKQLERVAYYSRVGPGR